MGSSCKLKNTMLTKETVSVNSKVAQLKVALEKHLIKNRYNAKWILDRIKYLNSKVTVTDYLQKHLPEWIGSTILHFAVEERDWESFNILLDNGADFTIKNSDGSTALHVTIQNTPGSILKNYVLDDSFVHSVLSAHLKNSNFQNPSDKWGLSHFQISCAANNLEVVRGFINSGVSINDAVKTDSSYFAGFSPLHFAAKFCAFEVVDVLLSYNANVHLKDTKGLTPLHAALERKIEIISDNDSSEAVRETNEKILKMLMNKEKNNSTLTIDSYGLSQFHVSCALQDSKIAEHFLQNHENINSVINKDSPSWPGYTPLHFAALCNINTVKLLMKRGADMNIKNSKGLTPFELCIERYGAQEIYAILSLKPIWKNISLSDGKIKLLDLVAAMRSHDNFNKFLRRIRKKVIISLPSESPLWPGCTPMHLAVIFSKTNVEESTEVILEIIKILHKQNPTMLYSQDVYGRTAVHLAFRLNKKPVLELLMEFLQECPNLVDHLDKDGLSFVHIASAKNQAVLLQRLLAIGTNVGAVYRGKPEFSPTIYRGSTALHFAVANDSSEAVEILINFGADVYAKDANDMTPIHLLSFYKEEFEETARILLSLPNLRDSVVSSIGLSHLHIASWYETWHDQGKAAKLLLSDGADPNGVITCRASANEEWNALDFVKTFAAHSSLLIATWASNLDTVRLLTRRGADCFIEDNNGRPWVYSLLEDEDHRRWGVFTDTLLEREDVLARVKAETGMTALHFACLCRHVEDVRRLLSEGAAACNVNERIRFDAPTMQGYTALHVVAWSRIMYDEEENEDFVDMLLKAGADVTLQSADSKTAVHVVHEMLLDGEECCYPLVNMMLEAQRDFDLNPVADSGLSHFHIACHFCNTSVVQKFLKHSGLDVNQRVDFFNTKLAGASALHLAARSNESLCGFSKQIATVDILLKHGADVHVEDHFGDTPLQDCIRYNTLDLCERLIRGGSDTNARNILGCTPLDNFLDSKNNVTSERIKTLLRLGCRFNSFNAVDDSGSVGRMVKEIPHADMLNLISAVIFNFPREMETDSVGRTIMHNVVSARQCETTVDQYAELFEQLLFVADCDVDHQDNLGRTALHMAAKFFNFRAVSALLRAGADVNITDINSKAAFFCDFASCTRCAEGNDESTRRKCGHLEMFNTWAVHIKKLQLCGLDVNKQNEDFASRTFEKFKDETGLSEKFFEELEAVKKAKIEPHSLTVYDFLSETGAVADYPRMSLAKREDVMEFFSSSKIKSFRKEFPQIAAIIQLQCRKVRARPQLVESAKIALSVLIGFWLPEICSEFILSFLHNSDLKSLIASEI